MAAAADLQSVEPSMKDYGWKDGGGKNYSSKLKVLASNVNIVWERYSLHNTDLVD
jgi:hypothetical protein